MTGLDILPHTPCPRCDGFCVPEVVREDYETVLFARCINCANLQEIQSWTYEVRPC